MRRKVYFRADGNAQMGLGHVIRSLALAEMLRDDFECHFIIRNPLSSLQSQILGVCKSIITLPETNDDIKEAELIANRCLTGDEIVVLDGYHFITEYQRIIKNKGCKLVCIDDIHSYHFVADVVINHAPGLSDLDYSVEHNTKLCLGLDYSLLRPPFLKAAKERRHIEKIENVFICFGGSDYNNITMKLLKLLQSCEPLHVNEVHVIIGEANIFKSEIEKLIALKKNIKIKLHYSLSATEICNLMNACQLAIVPASSILYEVIAVKMPVISGYYVENQISVHKGFKDMGLIESIGDFNHMTFFEEKLLKVIKNHSSDIVDKQRKAYYGQSDINLSSAFNEL